MMPSCINFIFVPKQIMLGNLQRYSFIGSPTFYRIRLTMAEFDLATMFVGLFFAIKATKQGKAPASTPMVSYVNHMDCLQCCVLLD